MSLDYLPEHVENALLALQLAAKEADHLDYTYRTLYAQGIDLAWVEQLPERQDRAEKIDAFVSRFARLQDHIGEKLLPRFAAMLGEAPKSVLDVLASAERAGWVDNAEVFIGARKLRNLLVHEYMSDAELFLETLLSAKGATEMLFEIIRRVTSEAVRLGIRPPG